MTSGTGAQIRPALPADVRAINAIVEPMTHTGILLGKDLVSYYEAVQEFLVAVDEDGTVVGCGALHVMWEDLAEVRTLAVSDTVRGTGLGHRMLEALLDRAVQLGLERVFCLTFEVEFFARHGFEEMAETVDPEIYSQLLRSPDEGIAEFLDLARVKPNTLGNTRMIKQLDRSA
ncbi:MULTISPECIES: amino-acid N-acetyltransferase [Brachybacterium]|uniref:Amino-acid N-acetyltransferase n=2 Tax=Brachybacterium TaxID=43668 RepID=A0A3R8S085_9MICO|nr:MULTISPECIES: amino-acid N-acetyltransferase [Brachybacterium]MCT1438021.1 amino-acid N-acetyltransferase [Brachybacterium paraconglomeratum]MCZ4325982.1 amino-acid N-acetyltransferase [Brachybacterium paraconglomeratum]MDV3295871.1 amino-acid N-acetyltransferase [Brachybacterium paraconglomeratum]RRR19880.1 amino-acid N-acetyltransferase [Brachybacterium paraconglomeratum]GAP79171.1 n-acetylglutamate synthase [Brachybacterium sp. SW0106-09]